MRLRRSRRRARCVLCAARRALFGGYHRVTIARRQGSLKLEGVGVRAARAKTTASCVPSASNDHVVRVKRPWRARHARRIRQNDRVVSLEEPLLKETTASRARDAPNHRVVRVKRVERPRRWCQTTASSPLSKVLQCNATKLQGTAVQRHWITRYRVTLALDYKAWHANCIKRQVFHAHCTKRQWNTRYSMPITWKRH